MKRSYNSPKADKKQMIVYAAVIVVAILIIVFVAVPDTIRTNERKRIREANTQLIRTGSLAAFDTEAERKIIEKPVQEPWIALRYDPEADPDARWTFLGSSVETELTEADLAGMNTLILCEDFVGSTSSYELIFNGTRQEKPVTKTSLGVRIRCIDLGTDMQLGESVRMEAKKLPARNPSESDRRYSDSDILERVKKLVGSGNVPGY